MRILLELPAQNAEEWARAADRAGLQAVVVNEASGLGAISAPPVILATHDARVVVPVALGTENPITLAEELLVLDALSGGRVVALLGTGRLSLVEAYEDVSLLRHALSGRPIRHRGQRWRVPAGLAEGVSESVIATPGATQIEIPIWVQGTAASQLAWQLGVPAVATRQQGLSTQGVQPARAALTGQLSIDREMITRWAEVGVTHLIVALPAEAEPAVLPDYVARFLLPEAAMVDFPRLLAEDETPPSWPGRLAPLD